LRRIPHPGLEFLAQALFLPPDQGLNVPPFIPIMKSSVLRFCVAAFGCLLPPALRAGSADATGAPDASQKAATTTLATVAIVATGAVLSADPQMAAQQVRSTMVAGIVNGGLQADVALAELQGLTKPMGLPADPAADFGYAAIDVGHRLIASGKPAAAEIFFKAGEASLAALVLQTPDTQAWNKAQLLQQLSLLRSHFLNNPVQAKADIERAIALQPNDALLQRQQALLMNEHSNLFAGGTH
jgi:hypothetical protein